MSNLTEMNTLELLQHLKQVSIAPVNEKFFDMTSTLTDLVTKRVGPIECAKGLFKHDVDESLIQPVIRIGDAVTAFYVPVDVTDVKLSIGFDRFISLDIPSIDYEEPSDDCVNDDRTFVKIEGTVYRRIAPFDPFLPTLNIFAEYISLEFKQPCTIFIEHAFFNPLMRIAFKKHDFNAIAQLLEVTLIDDHNLLPFRIAEVPYAVALDGKVKGVKTIYWHGIAENVPDV